MSKKLSIIPEGYELNNKGRLINASGKIVNKNGKSVNNNENNFQLPKRIKQNIFQHPKSEYSYIIIQNTNKNGSVIEKFVKVNKEQKPMKDGENYIYLNKNTGEAISGNGRKYVVNKLTKELAINSNGYIIENSSNNIFLPARNTKNYGSFTTYTGPIK